MISIERGRERAQEREMDKVDSEGASERRNKVQPYQNMTRVHD